MPCRDYYDDNPSLFYQSNIDGLRKQVSFAESALCQTLAAFEKYVIETSSDIRFVSNPSALDLINYQEAGITREQLQAWWTEHKEKDRIAREAAAKKTAAAKKKEIERKKKMLSGLTAEDLKALGLIRIER